MDINGNQQKTIKIKRNQGIKRRWTYSYVALSLVVLLIFEIAFMLFVTNYYYGNVARMISYRAEHSTQFYRSYINSEKYDLTDLAKQMVKDYNSRSEDNMELQVLDLDGNVVVSSTGFIVKEKIDSPDFKEAVKGYQSNWRGNNKFGEKVMSNSSPIKTSAGKTEGIIRYVVSLEPIDQTINKILAISVFIIIMVLFGMLMISYVFSRSIITPIKEITAVAIRMAEGQFSERIETKYDDEIGELAETLNYMAEEIIISNNLKNDFISSISHELRTPLTSIRGWGETILIGDFEDKEEARLGLKIIIKETTRLSKMVEELLDFSKMESGKIVLYLEEINLVNELEEVVNITKRRAEQEGIDLLYSKEDEIPNILGDANRLRQVFINIIDNAIKFTPSGNNVKVDVRSDEEHVYVDIRDEGIGIPETDIEFVKEKFFKGKSKKSGSGIGLAISNEIMELHKGKLNIDSVEGEGTTITLVFARIQPKEAE